MKEKNPNSSFLTPNFLQSFLLAGAGSSALVLALGGVELVADGEFYLARITTHILPQGA